MRRSTGPPHSRPLARDNSHRAETHILPPRAWVEALDGPATMPGRFFQPSDTATITASAPGREDGRPKADGGFSPVASGTSLARHASSLCECRSLMRYLIGVNVTFAFRPFFAIQLL